MSILTKAKLKRMLDDKEITVLEYLTEMKEEQDIKLPPEEDKKEIKILESINKNLTTLITQDKTNDSEFKKMIETLTKYLFKIQQELTDKTVKPAVKEEWDFEIIRDRNDDISNVLAKQTNANKA